MLRKGTAADLPKVRQLLEEARLPLDGVEDSASLYVAVQGDRVVGAIGYESYPPHGLLRSLVVHPSQRGKGLAHGLVALAVADMEENGLREAYGLTTTIPDLLQRWGWQELPRVALPDALRKSRELQGACPDSARAFRLRLHKA